MLWTAIQPAWHADMQAIPTSSIWFTKFMFIGTRIPFWTSTILLVVRILIRPECNRDELNPLSKSRCSLRALTILVSTHTNCSTISFLRIPRNTRKIYGLAITIFLAVCFFWMEFWFPIWFYVLLKGVLTSSKRWALYVGFISFS